MQTTRRNFLRGLAAATGLVAAEPVRRIWQVGANLSRTESGVITSTGLLPVEGQPGLFRDMRNGHIVNIRDFKECDRYNTIIIEPFVHDEVYVRFGEMSQKEAAQQGVFFRPIKPGEDPVAEHLIEMIQKHHLS